jgi:hypothetical protein
VMKRETPAQWISLLETHGIHSARGLAERMDVSVQTAVRLLHGEQTSDGTIDAAAELLGVGRDDIRRLRGEVALPPFRLPSEADTLSPRQRSAVLAVVRAMLDPGAPNATTMTRSQQIEALDTTLRGEVHALHGARKKSPKRP